MRGSRLIPILVISSLLFTSIVYACSGLRSVEMSFTSLAMDTSATDRGPCSRHKQDICKSVRDQMISVGPSSPLADMVLHLSTILHTTHFEIPLLMNLIPTTGPPGLLWRPVSRLSFPFSNQVL